MCSGFNIILHCTALNSFLDELDKRADECQKNLQNMFQREETEGLVIT